jgi:hypothetical protein
MRKSFLIYEEMRKYFPYMRRPLVINDFATAPLWISLYMRKILFSFYQCDREMEGLEIIIFTTVPWTRVSFFNTFLQGFLQGHLLVEHLHNNIQYCTHYYTGHVCETDFVSWERPVHIYVFNLLSHLLLYSRQYFK